MTPCCSLQFSLSPRAFACAEQALRRHGRDALARHVRGGRLALRSVAVSPCTRCICRVIVRLLLSRVRHSLSTDPVFDTTKGVIVVDMPQAQ